MYYLFYFPNCHKFPKSDVLLLGEISSFGKKFVLADTMHFTIHFSVAYLHCFYISETNILLPSGFGGLEVSVLAFGTQVHGFKPGRSRRIFWAKKSSAHLPSEGK